MAMHELPVIEKILKVALSHAESNGATKVVRIRTRIGELSDLYEDWMQRYFNYVSKGTIAEGAVLEVQWSPVIFRCEACEKVFPVKIREIQDVVCPGCGKGKVALLSGREFFVKDIEVT